MDAPIIISGLPRSGTTWVQHYLSAHPRIHIHGQLPKDFHWHVPYGWYREMVEKAKWANEANKQLGYAVPHYAGTSADKCADIFRQFFRKFLTGFAPETPRWGLKYIGLCYDAEAVRQFEEFWPQTRWIIGIRDPFRSFNSLRNTFMPEADLIQWFRGWVETCRIAEQHDSDRVATFDIDGLSKRAPETRLSALKPIWKCIGEVPTAETDEFVRMWRKVHEVRSQTKRSVQITAEEIQRVLDKVPGFQECMTKRGYSLPNE